MRGTTADFRPFPKDRGSTAEKYSQGTVPDELSVPAPAPVDSAGAFASGLEVGLDTKTREEFESADTQDLRAEDVKEALAEKDRQRGSYLRRNQVRHIYDQGKSAILGHLGVGSVLAFALSDVVTPASLGLWLTALFLICLFRGALVAAYFRQPKLPRRGTFWRNATIAASAAIGCVWGLTGPLFVPQVPMEHQLLISLVLGGITVAAIPVLAPLFPAFLAFMVCALTPVALWLFGSGNQVYVSMSVMFVVYGLVMASVALHFQRGADKALRLGYEKSDLVRRLSRAKESADATNRELEEQIQERMGVEAALRKSEARFRSAFDNAPISMALLNTDACLFEVNRTFEAMLGFAPGDLNGMRIQDITHPDDVVASLNNFRSLIEGKADRYQLKTRYRHRDGRSIWGHLSVSAVRDSSGAPIYAIAQIQDVTESHALSEKLSYQASHDALTGLVNRREFERRVGLAIESVREAAAEHALCYLDLDQFKVINDNCGHVAGDSLLRQLGSMLKTKVRRSDTVARLGGDEFGILIERCPGDEARRVAGDVLDAIRTFRFTWEDKTFSVGASIGLVPISSGDETVTDLLRVADSGCYAAKDHGRNRIHVCAPGDHHVARLQGEMQWVARINRVLEEGGLGLAFQPIVPVSAGKQSDGNHGELLLRLADESDSTKFHPPGAILAAAERYDMASRIDRWVIETAFEWFRRHPKKLASLNFCSINISGQSLLDEELLGFLTREFAAGDIPPEKICFEITETAAIANLADAIQFFESLKPLGCRFALDDFGSGMSSYAYLKSLPVDFVKIDGVFIRDIATDPISRAMVQSINEIGQVMGKKTIAEFVEDDAILRVLNEIGVDYAQGYGIGKPRMLDETGEVDFSARAA